MELLVARDPIIPLSHACDVLGMPRGTARRRLAPRRHGPRLPRPPSPRRLTPEGRQQGLDTLHSERLEDQTPRQVDAELVDDDLLDLLRTAVANAPRMTEARAVKRARDIAQDMGLQKLPTDFESLPKFPAVLEALATELVEAAA